MANFIDLDGSFKSLTDTLQNRLSWPFSEAVMKRWLGAMGHAAAIARDASAWSALSDNDARYDELVSDLDSATRALASASSQEDERLIRALAQTEQALDSLDSLLER